MLLTLENVFLDLPIYSQSSFSVSTVLKKLSRSQRFAFSGKTIIVQVLKDLNLTLKDGDRLGLIGLNGAGKTTLLKLMAGIYSPTSGRISRKGNVSCVFGTGFGMDEEATGYENIFLSGIFHGINRQKMKTRVDEIIDFTELEDFIYLPIRTYSSGMRARLAFAIATCYTPEILLIDEGIGAGDASFLLKAQKRLEGFMKSSNILVLASHSNSLVGEFCNKAILLDRGQVLLHAQVKEVIDFYMKRVNAA